MEDQTYIGADSSLNWHLPFEGWALMSIGHFVHMQTIANVLDSVLEAVPEGGVPGSVDKLVLVQEKSLCACDAVVPAHIIGPPVLSSEGSLHSLALGDVELVRRKFFLQALQVAFLVCVLPLGVGVGIFELKAPHVSSGIQFLNEVVRGDFAILLEFDVCDFVRHRHDSVHSTTKLVRHLPVVASERSSAPLSVDAALEDVFA